MKIYNPYKNTFEDLHSIQGMQLLKKYIKNYQNGGSGATATAITTSRPPTTEAVGLADIGSIGDGGGGGGGGGGGKPQEELPKYGSCKDYNSPGQFDACTKKIVVVFLGGFHPFHRGHFLSYEQAKKTFGEDVCFYVAASNSWPKYKPGKKAPEYLRPFPFEAKKQLAILSGVNENEIICEESPMVLLNLRKNVDIDNKHLIIVRSEKEIEDELITSDEEAIEIMVSKILSIKSNKMSKEEIRNKAEEQLRKLEEDPIKKPAYYKITGRGANRKIEYDNYQPIPDQCYHTDEYGNKTFKFNEESINLLNPKTEKQMGFIHITKTVNIEGVGSLDLSSGTKIRKAYINANSEEKKIQILSILYPNKTPKTYKYISAIYDTYLNDSFFENVPTKPSGKSKSKAGGAKKSKSKTAKKTL